jgi:hypothetical protein
LDQFGTSNDDVAFGIVTEGVGSHGSGESPEDTDEIAMISAFKSDAAARSM